ncbi:MAG: T9SS type A sorting domain-containing protein [Bacteroidales bacterium]
MRKRLQTLSMMISCSLVALAQWSSTPSENLTWKSMNTPNSFPGELVVDKTTGNIYATMEINERLPGDEEGEISLPIYLQIFDPHGYPMLSNNGMLITEQPTKGYSTGYSLITADNGDAIIAYTDVRHNGSAEIYLYRVTKEGKHLWFDQEGRAGKRLTDNEAQEMRLKMVKFDNDKYIVAWSEPGITKFTVIDKDGEMLDKYPNELADTSIAPMLLECEDNGFIISYAQQNGDGKYQLIAEKYDKSLNKVWQNTFAYSGVNATTRYKMISDGNNGVIFAWSWGVNLGDAYVSIQHIKADGTKVIEDNTLTDTNSNFQHEYPVITYDQGIDEISIAWRKRRKSATSSLLDKMVVRRYIGGIPTTGTSDADIMLFYDGPSYSYLPQSLFSCSNGDIIFTYTKGVSSGRFDEILTKRFDKSLKEVWGETITSKPTPKSLSRNTISHNNQVIMQWKEEEGDDQTSMRIQNISFDGKLGVSLSNSVEKNYTNDWASAYPTYVIDNINIQLNVDTRSNTSITIYNLLGVKIKDLYKGVLDAGRYDQSYNLSSLTKGIYIVEVMCNNQRYVQRIVIQ